MERSKKLKRGRNSRKERSELGIGPLTGGTISQVIRKERRAYPKSSEIETTYPRREEERLQRFNPSGRGRAVGNKHRGKKNFVGGFGVL